MPRLRVVKKPEDSLMVPEDQSVQVHITDEPVEVQELEVVEPETVEADETSAQKNKEKEVAAQPDEIITLKKQLGDLQKANEQALAAKADAERSAAEARKDALARSQERDTASDRAFNAEYDAVLNGLGAAQSELDAAQQEVVAAGEAADWTKMAKAQTRVGQASARLLQFEDAKVNLELKREEREKNPPTNQEQKNLTVDDYIDNIRGLLASERVWLKSHPDLMTDKRRNSYLQTAYFEAEDAKHPRGSDAYFQFMEEKLGYKQPAKKSEEEPEEEERHIPVSAPVTRETISPSSGKPVTSKINLSPEQREAARLAGIDEVTYAKEVIKLQKLKSEGHYSRN